MPIYTLPATPKFAAAQFGLVSNNAVSISPLNKATQTRYRPGAQWRLDGSLPAIKDPATFAPWRVLAVQMRGRSGRVYAGDPLYAGPRGTAAGVPLVKGGSQQGTSLLTDAWTAGQAAALLPGDMFAFETLVVRELKMVTSTVASNGSGNATLTFEPPIRNSPPDNTPIILSNPTGAFRFDEDEIVWDEARARVYGLTLRLIEALFL